MKFDEGISGRQDAFCYIVVNARFVMAAWLRI